MHTIAIVFVDIAIIMVAARLFGRLAIRVGQPPVVGEIVAGLALGPSLLGLLPGDPVGFLFPPDVLPYLNVLAQLGLILFMFIVGLELDVLLVRGREKVAGTISAASVALPFALGAGVALLLHGNHAQTDHGPVPVLGLALFMGVAMSITAFPVLARILADRGMQRTAIGVLALACAAVDDIIAWTLLAFVVAVVQGGSPMEVLRIVALTALFAAVMFGLVRPLLRRLVAWRDRTGRLTPDILAVVLIGVLVSSFTTEIIGIHAIFGAFVFGAVMPREALTPGAATLTHEILERLEQVSVLLLLPLFFVVTGLKTDIGGLDLGGLGELGLILVVAVVGKFVGAYVGARAMRVPHRTASAVGVLMNTRGLTELVILNVGLQLGVLDGNLFTMMVIMALVTTAMTGPLLKLVYSDRQQQRDIAAAERASLGVVDSYRVLTLVDEVTGDAAPDAVRVDALRIAGVGALLLGRRRPAQLVLSRLIRRASAPLELGAAVVPDLARMAGTVDDLQQLAAAVAGSTDLGSPPSVLARFTSDPWTDLLAQAEAVEADVVVVSEQWAAGHLPDGALDLPFTLVTARLGATPAAGSPVAVAATSDADARTAALLGAAAASCVRGPLLLSSVGAGRPARKLSGALAPVRQGGLDIRTVEGGPDIPDRGGDLDAVAMWIVGGRTPVGAHVHTVLRVRAGQQDRDVEFGEQVAELVPANA